MNEWRLPLQHRLSPNLCLLRMAVELEQRHAHARSHNPSQCLYLTIRVMLLICYADICMYCVAVIDFLNIAPWTNNPPICSLHRTKLIIVANSTALLTLLLINRGCPQIVKQTLCWFSECLNCILRGNCCHFQEKFKKVYWLVVTGWK